MIEPEERLFAGSGNMPPEGPYTWYVTDFDQRRFISVSYSPPEPVENLEDTEDICLAKLREYIDDLGPDVVKISFSDPEGPITVSTNIEDDQTMHSNCYPLSALSLPFAVKTIQFQQLTELDRMATLVDLVSYPAPPTVDGATITKAAFKYWFIENGKFRKWFELQNWSRLPRDHPHIVPFDAVVLDGIRESAVGFTSLYVPGGTLKDNDARSRPFRLVWLQQLMSVIDDLNYRYGIMHQDVAPRNLVIDEKENLRIFDFNYSIMIKEHYAPECDDYKGVVFTLYEIMTLDEHYRSVPHLQQDAEALLRLEWKKNPDVKLDHDVQEFRKVLDAWVEQRRGREFKVVETCIEWPLDMPDPPMVSPYEVKLSDGTKQMVASKILIRRNLIERKLPYLDWERPAGYRFKDLPTRK